MRRKLVHNILWDTDGESPDDLGLPEKVKVMIPNDISLDSDFEINQYINDYLSDNYGFCVIDYEID